MTNPDKVLVRHGPCPKCSSSDAGALYKSGRIHCYSCGQNTYPDEGLQQEARKITAPSTPLRIQTAHYQDLEDRGIRQETCEFWSYKVDDEGNHLARYKDENGGIVATKVRRPDKSFTIIGKANQMKLYGSWLWTPNPKKRIVITEGEIDALTVSQVQKNRWPTVSLVNGAQSAVKCLSENYDYLMGFEHIVLMFDMDEPGQDAAKKCAELFPAGKVSIAQLPFKDANECLLKGRGDAIIDQVFSAKIYRPDGIVDGADLWERLKEVETKPSAMFPWHTWNECFGGLRSGEVTMLTAGSGIGKTSIAREICYHLVEQGKRVGIIMLEETPEETTLELMSLYLNKRLRLNDRVSVTEDERAQAFKYTCGTGQYFFYDTKGIFDVESILSKMLYMRQSLNCDYILFDNITVSVAGIDAAADERRTIDRLMAGLRKLAVGTGVGFIVVSHLRRPSDGSAHEEGARVTLSQLRGSGNIVNFSNVIIGAERDQQGVNPNKMNIRSLKSRLYAKTGLIGSLHYNDETGRLTEKTEFKEVTEKTEDNPFVS